MLSLAQQAIFDRYKHPRFAGTLSNPTHTTSGINASCGDETTLYLEVVNGTVLAARHTTRGCAVCTASADMLMERAEGSSYETLLATTSDEIVEELGIPLSPTRMKCALLALNALGQEKTTLEQV